MKGLFAFILLLPLIVSSQNYLMDGSPIIDCSGTFLDSGGSSGNYGNNQNLSTTICSDGVGGTHVRLSFSGTDLAAGDMLCFYDGPNAASPLLSCASDYPASQPFVVQATAMNPTGCLTVTFKSNASGTASGWSASISCVASCQTVLASLQSTKPAVTPIDTGWIDICPGQRIFFTGTGVYPQNNFAYVQSDFSTSFEWNFGDGGISHGPNTSHRFDKPGGYLVQLLLKDTLGCRSTNYISQRIRVAHRPDFNLATVSQICAGDTLHLSATIDSTITGTTLSVFPISASFDVKGSRSDSLALPDGTGELYKTSIIFTEFSPGQVMTSASDLEDICVTMEHSWMRDMQISLTCPNGQSIILHDHPGNIGGEVYLGAPNDNDNFNPVPGLGFDYCWSPFATNPTWIQYANTVLGGVGTLPAGEYSSYNPISNLIGCPLNGEWTIGVIDFWPADNGYIFNWSMKFQDALYPNIETFTPEFVSWNWNPQPSIFYADMDSIAAAPHIAGTAGYTFRVNDAFGCAWDTLISVSVLPYTHPDCYKCATNFPPLSDASICVGDTVRFNATTLAPPTQLVQFEAFPDYKIGNANHSHSNPYLSPIAVNSLGYNFLSNPIQQITAVCMDIETDFDSDLNIFLRAPGGQQLMLSTGNGGSGDHYKTTCFSPSATLPIVGQTAPFNGTFIPEGNWNALSGAAVNGDWSLVVSDGFAPAQFGKVKWWSIGFNAQNTSTYNWTNATSLSCSNCPNPFATPSDTSIYVLTATDNHNCIYKDTVRVNTRTFFPAPSGLIVFELGVGTMTWNWNAVPGALGYEVSVNGGPWQSPNNGNLSHVVSGVSVGQMVDISVRCQSPTTCIPAIVSASNVYPNCMMFGTLFSTSDILCAGDSSGSAIISVSNAATPVQFYVDNNPIPFPNGDLLNILKAGSHSVIILDAMGCRDTVDFIINGPAPIMINASGTDILCNGDNSGSLNATAIGGTGGIAFTWMGCLGGPTFGGATQNNLFAGCYVVTATDGNGCKSTASVTLTEPIQYGFTITQDSVSCNGLSDGSANVIVTGGTGSYQYLWDNGSTTATAANLDAGFHFVTVTDANLCVATTLIEVLEPSSLIIDSIQAIAATCFDGNNGTATVFPIGGTNPFQYKWNDVAGQMTKKALMLGRGNYQVTVTDFHGCTDVATVNIGSPSELLFNFTNVGSEVCAGDCVGKATVSPSGGVGNYQFTWSDNTIPPGTQTANNLCPGNYTVTVTDGNGCTEVAQVPIVAAIPIVVNLLQSDPSCSGLQNGSATAQVSGGAMPYQYLWSNGSTNATANNLVCGGHSLTLTDALGCVKTFTITLNCPQTLTISNLKAQAVQCFGQMNGSVEVQTLGGTSPLSYLWNDLNNQQTVVATNLSAGTYTVTVTDVNGCNVSSAAQVTQPLNLQVNTTHTDASCIDDSNGTVTAIPSGGVGPYSINWGSFGNTATIDGLLAGTYFVTVTDANLCTATASAVISQPATAVMVTATQTRFSCWGEESGEASVSANGSNGVPFKFIWSNGQMGGGASSLSTGLYTVTATDSKGCTGTQVVAIQSLDSITVKTAYAPPTCAGYSNALVAVVEIEGGLGMSDTTLYNYAWGLPGAPNSTAVSGFSAGNYNLTVSDFQGCSVVHNFNVLAPLPIMVQVTVQEVSCFGLSDGAANISNIENAIGATSFKWNNQQITNQISGLNAGVYTVTVTDSKGCTALGSGAVNQPEALKLQFDITQLICSGDSNASVTGIVSGGVKDYSFEWGNGNNSATSQQLGAGIYTLKVTDQNGCTLVDSVEIMQPVAMQITLETIQPECYGGFDGRIRTQVSGGHLPFRFSLNDGPFGGSAVFIALGAGNYQVQVRDANGCLVSAGTTISQPPPVEVLVGLDSTLTLGDSLLISPTVNNAFGNTTYLWTSALVDSFTCVNLPECEEIWVKPGFSNTYQVKVTDENGCMGQGEIKITVEKPRGIYVPTGFTPNGDLENDLLLVHGKSRQVDKILTFKVFDRWGELLYEDQNFSVNDSNRGWDGSFRGKPCDPGVYVWFMEAVYIDGHIEAQKGGVTLVR